MSDPVGYKVLDLPWQPSDPAATEAMLIPLGEEGWQLAFVYPDTKRERTRWIFSSTGGSMSTGGGIPEAPVDGTLYGRQEAAWAPIPPATQGPTGPAGPQGTPGPTGAPGPTAVSANANNQARLGTDNLLFVPPPTSVKGVTDGSNAPSGMVGEVIAAGNPTGISLTTSVPTNLITLHLTPGDWTVASVTTFTPLSTGPNGLASGITLTSGTLPTDAEVTSGVGILNQLWASSMPSNKIQNIPTSMVRVNTSTPRDVFLVVMAAFGGGTVTATGYMSARRVR